MEHYSLVHGIKAKAKYLDLKQSKRQESTEAGGEIIQAETIMMDYFFLFLAIPLQIHFQGKFTSLAERGLDAYP